MKNCFRTVLFFITQVVLLVILTPAIFFGAAWLMQFYPVPGLSGIILMMFAPMGALFIIAVIDIVYLNDYFFKDEETAPAKRRPMPMVDDAL